MCASEEMSQSEERMSAFERFRCQVILAGIEAAAKEAGTAVQEAPGQCPPNTTHEGQRHLAGQKTSVLTASLAQDLWCQYPF